jgi:hypothetical protein
MNKKLQERKKKKHEQEAKGKVVRRREAIRKKAKYESSLDKDVAASREKIVPIINPHKEKLRKQKALEKNMEILKALEEDYKKEQDKRASLNAYLASQGHHTLSEKIQHMGENATKAAGGESLIEKTKRILETRLDSNVEVVAEPLDE